MLSPEQIENKEFTVRHIRGYDPTEVDNFLDEIVVAYRDLLAQLLAAKTDASRLRSTPTQRIGEAVSVEKPQTAIPTAIGDVARLLAVAQQSADQQLAEASVAANKQLNQARADADKQLADANATVGTMLADGQRQADEIIAQGHSKRNEIVGALEIKRSELQDKVDQLAATHAVTVNKLKSALDLLGDSAA